MSNIFTRLATCPEHVEGQCVNAAGHTSCPSLVCTNTTNDINNYKDDPANAGSFSFNTAFMKTLLRKSKFVALFIAGLFVVRSWHLGWLVAATE